MPHALAVRPDLQGKGLGKAVVREILKMSGKLNIKTVRLDILGGNFAAMRLYESMGFTPVQKKKLFYADTGLTESIIYALVLT